MTRSIVDASIHKYSWILKTIEETNIKKRTRKTGIENSKFHETLFSKRTFASVA